MLDEDGRIMVLRGLLTRKRDDLKLFRASARLTGFAQQLSGVLSDFQRSQLTPEMLNRLAVSMREQPGLAGKLRDFATLLEEYLYWLKRHELQDAGALLSSAIEALHTPPGTTAQAAAQVPVSRKTSSRKSASHAQLQLDMGFPTEPNPALETAVGVQTKVHGGFTIEGIWVDGFSEFS